MRQSIPYETAATILALVGVFALIAVFLPLINPGMYQNATGQAGEPLSYYLMRSPIPLSILGFSWYLNLKARRLKREDIERKNKESD